MPCARPASAGLSLSVSDTNGSTAANAYQSAARKISHRMASVSIPFCQLAILCRSVSAILVQVMVGPRGLEKRQERCQAGGGRKLTSCSAAMRTTSAGSGRLWMRSNSSFSDRVGRHPEQAGGGLAGLVEDAVRQPLGHADKVAGLRREILAVEPQIVAAAQHIDELILVRMNVRRHEGAAREYGVPRHRSVRLLLQRVGLAQNVPDDVAKAFVGGGDARGHVDHDLVLCSR